MKGARIPGESLRSQGSHHGLLPTAQSSSPPGLPSPGSGLLVTALPLFFRTGSSPAGSFHLRPLGFLLAGSATGAAAGGRDLPPGLNPPPQASYTLPPTPPAPLGTDQEARGGAVLWAGPSEGVSCCPRDQAGPRSLLVSQQGPGRRPGPAARPALSGKWAEPGEP